MSAPLSLSALEAAFDGPIPPAQLAAAEAREYANAARHWRLPADQRAREDLAIARAGLADTRTLFRQAIARRWEAKKALRSASLDQVPDAASTLRIAQDCAEFWRDQLKVARQWVAFFADRVRPVREPHPDPAFVLAHISGETAALAAAE